MSQRMINCVKLGIQAPGLSQPPFPGELGQEIYDHVSAQAWAEWQEKVQIRVINEYRLNLVDPDHFTILVEHLRAHLNLDDTK